MIPILLVNSFAVVLAAILPNEFLMSHSYLLYGLQLLTMMPYLARKTVFVKNLFLPTFFVLFYFLVNLTFGSYLVPREYGWNKEFASAAMDIRHYRVIVPYLLLANIVLFLLTIQSLRKLAHQKDPYLYSTRQSEDARLGVVGVAKTAFFFLAFLAVGYFDVYSAFSFQLALLIIHLTDPALRRKWYRAGAYAFYLAVLVGFSFDNKREIVMALFLMIFLEAYYGRVLLKLTFRDVTAYAMVIVLFFALILAASILRGYLGFAVVSVLDAFWYIPQYLTSDMFVDGITDNLELNYSYGVAVTSIDLGLDGRISYQLGASIFKIFFLPIPREVFPAKPESIMQIFTKEYAPEWWVRDGSLPVMAASEMFLNLHYFGLPAYALIWMVINKLFIKFHTMTPRSFNFYSCAFLFITVLMYARGSGIEQYLLYYLIAVPVFLLAAPPSMRALGKFVDDLKTVGR